jgi:hypothetical protein
MPWSLLARCWAPSSIICPPSSSCSFCPPLWPSFGARGSRRHAEPPIIPPSNPPQGTDKERLEPRTGSSASDKNRPAGRLSLADLLKAEASGDRTKQGADLTPKIRPVFLSESQRSMIWRNVGGQNARRGFNNTLIFSLGSTLPRYINLFDFSSEVLKFAPQCRDKKYAIVGDELLIADADTRQVVAIVPA